ncbi:MAG: DUF3857 domain-containing protein, partial [Lutimonas sp.]
FLHAQKFKFGSIDIKNLQEKEYELDPEAEAVVLYKKRNTNYMYSSGSGWRLVTEVIERIKIYDKEGVEYASKKIPYYKGDSNESVSIKAVTYNLENGKIVKTKLDGKEIYDEDINEDWSSKNFTMPNINEGSIVEWKYTLSSPYVQTIDEVVCQYDIPIKELQCKIEIPEFFVFRMFPSRYYPIDVRQSKGSKKISVMGSSRSQTSWATTSTTSSGSAQMLQNIYNINAQNIPALKEEPYVNSMDNYRAIVKFEISAYKPRNGVPEFYNTSWEKVTETIYKNPRFGRELSKNNHFSADLEQIIAGTDSNEEKIKAIFQFVQKKVKWDENYGKYTNKGVAKAYKEGHGNAAEVNLTLVSMLRNAGLKASPVLVSTRSHGIPLFPTKQGFNFVIAAIEMPQETILLDATDPNSAPNLLPVRDLNWEGRLIREDGSSIGVDLYPHKYNLKTVKMTAKIDTEGEVSGVMISTYKNLNALLYRSNYSQLSEDDLISKLESENGDIEIERIRLNNIDNPFSSLTEMIQFTGENQADFIGDKIYVSPLLFLSETENPFKMEKRSYPLDFASAWRNEINLILEIPEQYTVESKPEDVFYTLPENLGSYSLKTSVEKNKIVISSSSIINKAIVPANYYDMLKDIYKKAIDTQMEKIVLAPSQT